MGYVTAPEQTHSNVYPVLDLEASLSQPWSQAASHFPRVRQRALSVLPVELPFPHCSITIINLTPATRTTVDDVVQR